jgi:hypothetical protein
MGPDSFHLMRDMAKAAIAPINILAIRDMLQMKKELKVARPKRATVQAVI